MRSATVTTGTGKFGQRIRIGEHELVADEPRESGGDDSGPAPHEFLLAGLGACTSMTLKMFADRKAWPLTGVEVVVEGHHDENKAFVIERRISLAGELSDEQRTRLLEIANKCPVHKTLTGTIRIDTRLV